MGRLAGFVAELLALARAVAEVVALYGRHSRGGQAPARDGSPHGHVPGPAVLAPVDQPAGPAVVQPEVRGPEEGLTDHV
jgi:hypothetical protein